MGRRKAREGRDEWVPSKSWHSNFTLVSLSTVCVKDSPLSLALLKYAACAQMAHHQALSPLPVLPWPMSSLPSPPLNPLSPEPSYSHYSHQYYQPIDPGMKALLTSSLRIMDQASILAPAARIYPDNFATRPLHPLSAKFWRHTKRKATAIETCCSPCSTQRALRTRSVF